MFDAEMDNAVNAYNIDLFDGPWNNPRKGDDTFNLNDNSTCTNVCSLSACFDDELLRRTLNKQHSQHCMSKASDNNGLDNMDITYDIFLLMTHVDNHNSTSKEYLSTI